MGGELDLNSATRVKRAIASACVGGREELVMDLGELTLIDSIGVRVLLSAVNRCATTLLQPRARALTPSRAVEGAPHAGTRWHSAVARRTAAGR